MRSGPSSRQVVLQGGPPWGFRMYGDAANGVPFRISRINPDGVSGKSELREGELVLEINGIDCSTLTTDQAHQLMRGTGDSMLLLTSSRGLPSPFGTKSGPSAPDSVEIELTQDNSEWNLSVLNSEEEAVRAFDMLAEGITGGNPTGSSIAAGNHAYRHGSGDASRTSSTIDSGVASSNTVTSSPLLPPSPKSHRTNCSTSRQKGSEVWKPGQQTTDSRSTRVIRGQRSTEQVKDTAPLIKTPVWTPPGSPQTSKKQFRPVNFDKSLESHSRLSKSTASSVSPPPPPASESYAWSSPDGAGIFSGAGLGGSSTLPRTQSATITLLQQARRGQLPRGAKYLTADECDDSATQPVNYNIPRLRLPPPKEVDGVGPTTQEGMPVALRSTVKVENKGDWYRKVYDNLHKQPAGHSAVDGYYSEPDLSFDEDEIRYSRSSLKQLDRYRGQPGRIEDYLPGKSSIAQQHSAKFWEELIGYFEQFLQDNPHIRSANLQKLRNSASAARKQATPDHDSFTQSVLDGYESDPALIYHRQITPQLTSSEQKQYYTQIQRGGEIPACGLRKPAPEKPKELEDDEEVRCYLSGGSLDRLFQHEHDSSLPPIPPRPAARTLSVSALGVRSSLPMSQINVPMTSDCSSSSVFADPLNRLLDLRISRDGQRGITRASSERRSSRAMVSENDLGYSFKRRSFSEGHPSVSTLPRSKQEETRLVKRQAVSRNTFVIRDKHVSRSNTDVESENNGPQKEYDSNSSLSDPRQLYEANKTGTASDKNVGVSPVKKIDATKPQLSPKENTITPSKHRRHRAAALTEEEKLLREKCWNNPKLRTKSLPRPQRRCSVPIKANEPPAMRKAKSFVGRPVATGTVVVSSTAGNSSVFTTGRPSSVASESYFRKTRNGGTLSNASSSSRLTASAERLSTGGSCSRNGTRSIDSNIKYKPPSSLSKLRTLKPVAASFSRTSIEKSSIRPTAPANLSVQENLSSTTEPTGEKMDSQEFMNEHDVVVEPFTVACNRESATELINMSSEACNALSGVCTDDGISHHNTSHVTSASEETGYMSSESHSPTDVWHSLPKSGIDDVDNKRVISKSSRIVKKLPKSQTNVVVSSSGKPIHDDISFLSKQSEAAEAPRSLASMMSDMTDNFSDTLIDTGSISSSLPRRPKLVNKKEFLSLDRRDLSPSSLASELRTLRQNLLSSGAPEVGTAPQAYLPSVTRLLRLSRRSQHFQKLKPHYLSLQRLTESGMPTSDQDRTDVLDKVYVLLEMLRVYDSYDAAIQQQRSSLRWRGDVVLHCRGRSVEDLRRMFANGVSSESQQPKLQRSFLMSPGRSSAAGSCSPRTCYSVDVTDLENLGERNEFVLPVLSEKRKVRGELAERSERLLKTRKERIERPLPVPLPPNGTVSSLAHIPNQVQKPPRQHEVVEDGFRSLPVRGRRGRQRPALDVELQTPQRTMSSAELGQSQSNIEETQMDSGVSAQRKPLPTPRDLVDFTTSVTTNKRLQSLEFQHSSTTQNGITHRKSLKRIFTSGLNSLKKKLKPRTKQDIGLSPPEIGPHEETAVKWFHSTEQSSLQRLSHNAAAGQRSRQDSPPRIRTIGHVTEYNERLIATPRELSLMVAPMSASSPDLSRRETRPRETAAVFNDSLYNDEFRPMSPASVWRRHQAPGPASASTPRDHEPQQLYDDVRRALEARRSRPGSGSTLPPAPAPPAEFDWSIHRPIGRYVPGGCDSNRAGFSSSLPRPPPRRHLQSYNIHGTLPAPIRPRPAPRKASCPRCRMVSNSELNNFDVYRASDQRYQESNVNIHYRSPVRWEEKQPLSEEELGRRQEEAMKRIYQETRLRKQQQQTEDMLSRRHGDNFTPSQKSPIPLDRYDRLFGDEADSAGGGAPLFGTVLHDFQAQNNRELGVSKGDTVRIRRNVDSNWMEAQRGTRIGILPVSYVQINDPRARPGGGRWTPKPQVRTRYHFQAQNNLELSLNKGDIVTVLKRVDDNWFEGRLGDRTGIFPISYVEPLDTDQTDARGVSTERQIKPQVSPVTHGIPQPNKQTPAVASSCRQLTQLPRPTEKQLHVDVLQPHVPYRALYPYMRQNDDEMELREGDVIHVLEQCPDGWYVGTNQRSGMFGTFPGNYAQRL